MVTACRSGSHRDSCPCVWGGDTSCCSRIEHAKWEGPPRAEKGSVSRVTRKAARIPGVGVTDLQAGLSRGLQGMLQGLAEEIIGDGRPGLDAGGHW